MHEGTHNNANLFHVCLFNSFGVNAHAMRRQLAPKNKVILNTQHAVKNSNSTSTINRQLRCLLRSIMISYARTCIMLHDERPTLNQTIRNALNERWIGRQRNILAAGEITTRILQRSG